MSENGYTVGFHLLSYEFLISPTSWLHTGCELATVGKAENLSFLLTYVDSGIETCQICENNRTVWPGHTLTGEEI